MDFLEFSFQSFWHFVGVVMILGMLCRTLVILVTLICTRVVMRVQKEEDDED